VCTGHIVPPEVRTECRQSCDTVCVSHQECTPGMARLDVDASGAAAAASRVSGVVQAVAARMPEIHALSHRLQDLREAGSVMVKSADDAAGAASQMGGKATLCIAEIAGSLPGAVARLGGAFQVTVKITVSFGADVVVY
jgi:hypothetical protein